MADRLTWYCLIAGLVGSGLCGPAAAEAALDGSTGSTGSFAGDFEIPAAVGRLEGANLFHSFATFNIREGESATFTGPGGIDNVISRVTGRATSEINGRLASTVPGADFFFLNPAGVVFGPNASLDLPGSFHVSTADGLRFQDGSRFSATDPSASTFTMAAPEAFGFLGQGVGAIALDRGRLEVDPGETLSLSAGGIALSGGNVGGAAGALIAPAGNVLLTSISAQGEAGLDGSGPGAPGGGPILLTDQAAVVTEGDGGGQIRIRGGSLVVENLSGVIATNTAAGDAAGGITVDARSVGVRGRSSLLTRTTAGGSAGEVVVRAGELDVETASIVGSVSLAAGAAGPVRIDGQRVTVTGGGRVNSDTAGSGNAGPVLVTADQIDITANGQIRSSTFGAGDAGSVAIDGSGLLVQDGNEDTVPTGILSDADFGSSGDAGAVTVRADLVEVLAGAQIRAITFTGGNAGAVDLEAVDLTLDAQGVTALATAISSSAAPGSAGNAGAVRVVADGMIQMLNGGQIRSVNFGPAQGGEISVGARSLAMSGGATISTEAFADGPAGDVAIRARSLTMDQSFIGANTRQSAGPDADAGTVTIDADRIEFVNDGRIFNGTDGPADGGDIIVRAGTILADVGTDPTQFHTGISASANAGSAGRGGDVIVTADRIVLVDGGEITSSTNGRQPAGNLAIDTGLLRIDAGFIGTNSGGQATEAADAGTTTITAERIEFVNDGRIFNGTDGQGDGGDIVVEADVIVARVGTDPTPFHTGISASANFGSSGRGGDVTVRAQEIQLLDRSEISSDTDSVGDAGNVRVVAGEILLRDGGQIFTTSSGRGDAGDIVVTANELRMDDGRISTEADIAGGGRIVLLIDELLDMDRSDVATSVFGGSDTTAGDITIDPTFIVLNGSRIVANARQGTGGDIRIAADNFFTTPDSLIDASSELGIDGTVEVTAPDLDLTSELTVLPSAYIDVSALLRESCAARASDQTSSFATEGGRLLAPDPAAPLPGRYAGDRSAAPAAFHHWSLAGSGACDG